MSNFWDWAWTVLATILLFLLVSPLIAVLVRVVSFSWYRGQQMAQQRRLDELEDHRTKDDRNVFRP